MKVNIAIGSQKSNGIPDGRFPDVVPNDGISDVVPNDRISDVVSNDGIADVVPNSHVVHLRFSKRYSGGEYSDSNEVVAIIGLSLQPSSCLCIHSSAKLSSGSLFYLLRFNRPIV